MRIWILNHYASPPDKAAGTRHYDFGRVLAEQGHEVTIFASSFNHLSGKEGDLRRVSACASSGLTVLLCLGEQLFPMLVTTTAGWPIC